MTVSLSKPQRSLAKPTQNALRVILTDLFNNPGDITGFAKARSPIVDRLKRHSQRYARPVIETLASFQQDNSRFLPGGRSGFVQFTEIAG